MNTSFRGGGSVRGCALRQIIFQVLSDVADGPSTGSCVEGRRLVRDTEDFTPPHVFAGQHGQLRYANVSVMDDAADLHRAYTVMQ